MHRPSPRGAVTGRVRSAPDPAELHTQELALRARLAEQPGNAMAWQQLAGLLAASGRPAQAADAFARATAAGASAQALAPPHAMALSAAKRHDEAVAVLRPAHARKPKDFALANLLGVMLKRAGRFDEAVAVLEAARRLDPRSISPWQNLGNVHDLRGDFAAAAAAFQGGLKIEPRNAELWRLHGRARRGMNDLAGARESLQRAFGLNPRDRDTASLLVGILLDLEAPDAALAVAAKAREARPEDPTAEVLVARVQMRAGEIGAARSTLDRVLSAHPGELNANLLLVRLHGDADHRAANDLLRRGLAANPASWEIADALAESLSRSRYDDEAAHLEEAYAVACRLLAEHPDKMARLARTLRTIFQRVFDLDRMAATGQVADLLPHWQAEGRHSSVHYELGQVDTLEDRLALVAWHREWGRRAAVGIAPVTRPPMPALATGRKLRIGFMSSDLRNHPVSYFALPLLESYDRDRVEVFCYSFYEKQPDPVQQHIESRVTAFRCWPKRPDAQVAAGIAQDRLDMLFELGGSTAMNKLEVMAYRPARLGASWLGYPHSAGLAAIDYILTDPYIRPADPSLLIEQPFELPETWVALGRLGFHDQPILEGLPEERRGYLTFGTANNPYKYTSACVDTWAAVLRAVPGSHFLFLRPEAAGASFVANARAAFAARDVDPARLDFIGVRGSHMQHYNAIDIALDSLPHVGGTTTCEALWMGVPTVTLVGPGFPERLSYSNLSNAGLGELAAFTTAEYVSIATRLAADRASRRFLRHGLRERIRARPLGQVDRFVQHFYAKAAEVAAR
jgi:protein O-GlcNAc transferase